MQNFFLEWLDLKRCNKKRLAWGVIFFILGFFLIIFSGYKFQILSKILKHWIEILWVLGWSSLGISAGLINRRPKTNDETNQENQNLHYIIYYLLFALFVSSLAGYALGMRENGNLNYPLAALISVTMGIAAKKFNDLALMK